MRAALALLLACATALLAVPAFACGGAFGAGMTIDASQTIVVAHRDGVESYVFRPHFCGQAAQFGLILPIPGTLTDNPSLASTALFTELDALSAPLRMARTECRGSGGGDAGAVYWGADAGVATGGPVIIDRGQVGIFDWVLIKADTSASFTAWLDANGFPHEESAGALFDHYVQKGWYFVAFKVTAGESAPPSDSLLCGDLGPIELSFNAATPVVPTRIAAASTSEYQLSWRIYAVAARQLGSQASEFYSQWRFASGLDAARLASAPELAKIAVAGDRLSKIDVSFYSSTEADLSLSTVTDRDFRETVYDVTYVDCGHDGSVPYTDATVADGSAPHATGVDGGFAPYVPGDGEGCSASGTGALFLGMSAMTLLALARRRASR